MKKLLPSRDYTALLLAFWWVLHFARPLYFQPVDEGTAAVNEGDIFNQFQYLLLACIGLPFFRIAWLRLRAMKGIWKTALSLYVFWAILTIAWSVDPSLSLRRVFLFLVALVTWVGLGAGYYGGSQGPQKLSYHVRIGALILVVLSLPMIGPELTPSNLLNPYWESSIRQTTPDVIEAAVFGLLACWAPQFAYQSDLSDRKRAYLVIGAVVFAFLLITKGRAAIAMTLLVLGFSATRMIPNRLLRISAKVALAGLLAISVSTLSFDYLQGTQLGEYLARGNRTLEGLNGRGPLWEYVLNDIAQRPLQGWGFGGYWTAERMSTVWSRFKWHAPLAHNGYLDETLQTGLIGLSLICLFLLSALSRIRTLLKYAPQSALAFSWVGLFFLLNLTDSYFQNFRRMGLFLPVLMCFSCLAIREARARVTQRQQPASGAFRRVPQIPITAMRISRPDE